MKLKGRMFCLTCLLVFSSLSKMVMADEWVANVGVLSEYHVRGMLINDTAILNASVNYENDGFSAGSWVGQIEDGLEFDFYARYGWDFDNGISLTTGLKSIQFTSDIDTQINELNFYGNYAGFSFEQTFGVQSFATASDQAFSFSALSYQFLQGFYVTLGAFGGDFSGEYGEFGYRTVVKGLEIGATYIRSGRELDDNESVFFTISHSFSL